MPDEEVISENASRFKSEPTVVIPKPPVDCNWKKSQVITFTNLKKLFAKPFHHALKETGKVRITQIVPDSSGRSFTIHAKLVGDKTLEYTWTQFWWERGPKENRKEGFYYCALFNNQPNSNPSDTKPARSRNKSKRKK